MNNEEYVNNNLINFDSFYEKVQKEGCDLLKQLMNESWHKQARLLVQIPWRDNSKPYDILCYPYNWLGDGVCCDNAWDLVNKSIPVIVKRTNKIKSLRGKLKSIKKGNFYQTIDTIFELFVLYQFSNVIIDTEHKVKDDSGSNVDAVIKLKNREVFLEASRISKDLINPNIRTGTMSILQMKKQVIDKIESKIRNRDGKPVQLGLAKGPTILVISPPVRGTNQDTIRWALESEMSSFPEIGVTISSLNCNFAGCEWYVNTQANYPFADDEIEQLKHILWQTDPVIIESNTAVNL